MKTDFTNQPSSLGPELYDKDYYLKSLPGFEYLEKDKVDPAILETTRFGAITAGDRILDFGCGRGNLVIELAKRGVYAVGVDFSKDAVEFAETYAAQFSEEVRNHAQFFQLTMNDLQFENEFDKIIFNQVYEHLRDWELTILIEKFKRALKLEGLLVISTPNLNYIRYLYPLKRILELPFKWIKEPLRVLRGKSKHTSSFKKFLREIFKIQYPDSEHTRLHINLQTPNSIRRFLNEQGFSTQVSCVDRHSNWISRLTAPWWGETIWVVAKIQKN